jgi:hypothetical protein
MMSESDPKNDPAESVRTRVKFSPGKGARKTAAERIGLPPGR